MSLSSTESEKKDPLTALKHVVGTDVGRRREENQDFYGVVDRPDFKFYIVADGMGGAKGGATASHQAVNTVTAELSNCSEIGSEQISAAIQKANSVIFEQGSSDEALAGMGTTFVGVAFRGQQMFVTNVGDSRAYRFRGDKVVQMTNDHTLVKELLRSGAISAEQADNHPVSHMLTRSLGPTPEVEVDCWLCPDGPARGDLYLLCSDGLYNLVPESDMALILKESPLDEAVQKLIDLANERGGTDNITVMLAEVGPEFPLGVEDYPENPIGELPYLSQPAALTPPEKVQTDSGSKVESSAAEEWEKAANVIAQHSKSNGSAQSHAEPLQADTFSSLENQLEQDLGRQETVKVDMPARRSHLVSIGLSTFLVLCGVLIGLFYTDIAGKREKLGNETVVMNPLAAVIAASAVDRERSLAAIGAPELKAPALFLDEKSEGSARGVSDENSGSSDQTGQYSVQDQIDAVRLRRETLETRIQTITEQIAAFDKPLSGETAARLKQISLERDRYQKEVERVRAELDTSTRKLALFFGRRQRLQSTDPVDLANEVAVSSEAVRQKKEAFERATWAYLKEVEVWRVSQSDENLTKNVSQLGRQREQRRRELAAEVKDAIEQAISEAEQDISRLNQSREAIQSKIDQLGRDQSFIKVLTGSNPKDKADKKQDLMHERELLQLELDDLKRAAQ